MTTESTVSRLGAVDMSTFKPKSGAERRPTAEEIDRTARLPSREAVMPNASESDDSKREMLGINTNARIAKRFREMARTRRSYGQTLEILMDAYEERAG